MYRPLWSDEILQEVGTVLEKKLGLTQDQCNHRITEMSKMFPEAMVQAPQCMAESLTGIPDAKDRHVLASAIFGHAQVIVTNNVKDFPSAYLSQFQVLCHTADDFLVHQFHLNPYLVTEKLDAQAINISQARCNVLSTLKRVAPKFIELVEQF